MITVEELRTLLSYEPTTGIFVWRTKRPGRQCGDEAGTPDSWGYIQIRLRGRRYAAHRLAWLYVHGEWPPSEIDHANGNPGDNRLVNLRPATKAQNNFNKRAPVTNKSGVKGVRWHTRHKKWVAEIRVNGKKKHLGCFDSLEKAAAAYRDEAIAHHGEFANTGYL